MKIKKFSKDEIKEMVVNNKKKIIIGAVGAAGLSAVVLIVKKYLKDNPEKAIEAAKLAITKGEILKDCKSFPSKADEIFFKMLDDLVAMEEGSENSVDMVMEAYNKLLGHCEEMKNFFTAVETVAEEVA